MLYLQGLLCDLLWSDPDEKITGWVPHPQSVTPSPHPLPFYFFSIFLDFFFLIYQYEYCLTYFTACFTAADSASRALLALQLQ